MPLLTEPTVAQLLEAAHVCDGLVKGLKHPDWPLDPWDGLKRLVLMTVQGMATPPSAGRTRRVMTRLALSA